MKINLPDLAEVRRRVAMTKKDGRLWYRPRPVSDFEGLKRPAETLHKIWTSRFCGKEWGRPIKSGHISGRIGDTYVYAHHIVWALTYDEWPTLSVNHINGDPSDNRPENLRLASQAVVCRNQSLHKDNKSGHTGILFRKDTRKWMVRVGKKYIGCYPTKADAIAAHQEASRVLNFHPNHGKRPSRYAEQEQNEKAETHPCGQKQNDV